MPNLEKYSRLKEEKKELTTEPQAESKVVITGDDVLIEYVKRLISCIKSMNESDLEDHELGAFEKFIGH